MFLYGAAVQGIQKYIFQTNKLKEIIGASELVKNICDDVFMNEFAGNSNVIVHAAGNVKCVYSSREECERTVMHFPKRVMEMAPGVTVSQAVVPVNGDSDYASAIDELEKRLHAQRNKAWKSLAVGSMGMERSRTTGLPAVAVDKGDFIDGATMAKREVMERRNVNKSLFRDLTGRAVDYDEIGFDTKDLTGRNDWIAVVHADGNGLGEVVAKIGKDPDALKEFSESLDRATKQAAQRAYRNIEILDKADGRILPIRPIVIGGDDLTIVCRADLAVEFVRNYLDFFEEESVKETHHPLTACAGIAFIKSSYPFYYGYELAEALCGQAKKDAKSEEMKKQNDNKAPSCLMFHKVQSSFVESFNTIKAKELTPAEGHSLSYGPYYLTEQKDRWTIGKLMETVEKLSGEENNPIKSNARKWLTLMHDDVDAARQHSKRVLSLASGNQQNLYSAMTEGIEREGMERCYPVLDVLSMVTIHNQITKK